MGYRVSGLDSAEFAHLFGLSDAELAAFGAKRYVADADSGFPDRIELRDAKPGESLILLNHMHQDANSPYRSCHAIFVLEGARERVVFDNTVPEVMTRRVISLRGFDAQGMIVDADLAEGVAIEGAIKRMFSCSDVEYIHAHNAKPGCYAARIDRI